MRFNWPEFLRNSSSGAVTALVAVADPAMRRSLKRAISREVDCRIIEVEDSQAFHHAVAFNEIDLIVADADLKGGCSGDIIEQIRFGRLHCHAFPVVAMLVADVRSGNHRNIDCGADLVLNVEDAARQLAGHLAAITQSRKSFAVTHHYIGPDRRTVTRKDDPLPVPLVVPNPLMARSGGMAEMDYRRQVSLATYCIGLIRQRLYTKRSDTVGSVLPMRRSVA